MYAVSLAEGGLEHIHVGEVGGKAGQALFATATHTYEEGVASRTCQDATDPTPAETSQKKNVCVITVKSVFTKAYTADVALTRAAWLPGTAPGSWQGGAHCSCPKPH